MQIYGDTSDLSPSETKALQRIYRRRVPLDRLTTPELTRALVGVSHATGRQVGVLVDRRGTVHHVILGDASKLMLPDVGRLRAGAGRLRGLRLIHTHLRNEPLSRDDLVDLTRLRLDLIVAICLASGEERALCVYYGHNFPVAEDSNESPFQTFGPIPYAKARDNPAEIIETLEQEFARAARARGVAAKDGRAILVHVCDKRSAGQAEDSLRELEELARTAGVDVADRVLQVRERVDPRYALGRGKLEDLVIRAMQLDVETLIFDRDLRPAQANNIARMTDLKVVDRTQLILDIFAQHAESRDGKLQVELAQMRYILPRLGQRDDALSRLTGGIGGRGPGETKLEVGRRRARERITRLQSQLKQLGRQRRQRRSRRQRSGTPTVAIVGYTNAGKSTLLNSLTGSDVIAEDKLFATLDTRSRRLLLPSGRTVIFTDTVGFIRDLPKDLFAAFRATFDETQDADLLLHVIDASDPCRNEHVETTEELLVDLGLERVPRILVFNKCDRLEAPEAMIQNRGIAISAIDPSSLGALRAEIDKRIAVSNPIATAPEPTSSPPA
ncbi:MAG: GTPase HflX [Myxococcales bacterium]|nr:GTPase HflX [Myxococcales bacterium]MDH3842328.1 GTPase HflX [Myxococcales bacterium]